MDDIDKRVWSLVTGVLILIGLILGLELLVMGIGAAYLSTRNRFEEYNKEVLNYDLFFISLMVLLICGSYLTDQRIELILYPIFLIIGTLVNMVWYMYIK